MQTKAHLFPDDLIRLADLAKALSHPARLEILRLIARRNECICEELTSDLPLAQATVSQHLKVLKEAGLIVGEIDGPRTCYCLESEALSDALDRFLAFFGNVQACCGPSHFETS